MYIEGFGNKELEFYEIDGTNDLYLVSFFHENKKYTGIVDVNGNALIPFSKVPIQEIFSNSNYSSYCFTRFYNNRKKYESFHLKREDDGSFHIRANISGNDYTNCRIIGTEKDNYWLIESTTDGITEFNLYDVNNARILTPKFTEISFEKEESRVLAYVEKDIYTTIDGVTTYLTSLSSFIDYEGNFITSIYDIEGDKLYNGISYNFDKKFKRFNNFVIKLKQDYTNKFLEKQQHIAEIQDSMFQELYSIDEMKPGEPAKILSYWRDSSND